MRARVIGLRHLVGCSTGPLTRAGQLGERDAPPPDPELFGRSSAFSPPIPPLSIFSSISTCTLRARRLAPCGVSPLGLLPARAPSVVSHHLRRLSPPLLASRAHSIGFRFVVCRLCSNLNLNLALAECRFSKERRGVHSTASHLCIPRRLILFDFSRCLRLEGGCDFFGIEFYLIRDTTCPWVSEPWVSE